jgi:hypothetical protein
MLIAKALIVMTILALSANSGAGDLLPGFQRSPWFGEQVCEEKTPSGIRMIFNAPGEIRADRPTTVVFYATPNGNSIEQTLGCALFPGMDWHFDIQHIAAQTRLLREMDRSRNYILVCMEAEGRSWPSWRQKHPDSPQIIRETLESTMREFPGSKLDGVVAGHSGGGSMITGYINAYDELPSWVTRIAYLDANYSYDDDQHHGDKLLAWLKGDPRRHLVVMAYDDREIMLDGKKVLGPTGGTFRASHRMLSRFEKDAPITRSELGQMDRYDALDGRIAMFIHRNPANKILHTALIGEMNGYLEALTLGTPFASKWGTFGGPRAYTRWVQAAPISVVNIPPRPKRAVGGTRFMKSIADLPREEREAPIMREMLEGNLPSFLREFVTIKTTGKDASGNTHEVIYQVMPDYLSVGSDRDFVRLDITPMTAQAIADAFDCSLPTTKMVDEIYLRAEVKLEPKPMTKDRESVLTFIEHNSIIEEQRKGKSAIGGLVAGHKKDVVITNRIYERPHRVAIYGWHKLDGTPIQPLTIVHVDWYVDYSHGIRLVKRSILVDGIPRDIRDVLKDPVLAPLLSDEGPIEKGYYLLSE